MFTPAKLVKLATILKLGTSPPATTAQRAKEITIHEQPVASWQEISGAE